MRLISTDTDDALVEDTDDMVGGDVVTDDRAMIDSLLVNQEMLLAKIEKFRRMMSKVDMLWVMPGPHNGDDPVVIFSQSYNLLIEHDVPFIEVDIGLRGTWRFQDFYNSEIQFGCAFSSKDNERMSYLSILSLDCKKQEITCRFRLEYLSWPGQLTINAYIHEKFTIKQYLRITEMTQAEFDERYGGFQTKTICFVDNDDED